MDFNIDNNYLLLSKAKIEIIKNHIIHSDIPVYIKHQNINNTIWITDVLFRNIYNISLSDFENYYPGTTFQNEIKGLKSDIHSPIYKNNNIYFFDCSKIKYTQFDYVSKILSYLIESSILFLNNEINNKIKKNIFDFLNDEIENNSSKNNLLNMKHKNKKASNKNKTKNKTKTKHGRNNNKKISNNNKTNNNNNEQIENTTKIECHNYRNKAQIWVLNPNSAIELFLKKIEVFIQNNSNTCNFVFISNNNKIKYSGINKLLSSCSSIKLSIDTTYLNNVILDESITKLLNNSYNENKTNNNTSNNTIHRILPKIIDILYADLNNDILLIKLALTLWLKKYINTNNINKNNNKKESVFDENNIKEIRKYIYTNIYPEIPLFKISNTLFQNFHNAKTINPIINYYQYSFSLLSIPNIINELCFYFQLIINKYYIYSEYESIKNINISQKIELLSLITKLQHQCIYLDKPICELQSFFLDCIKIIKKY